MKIILSENQFRLIKESEEKQQLLNLINTGDKDNIELAYQIAIGMGIWDKIIKEYRSFLKLLDYPEDINGLFNIFNKDLHDVYVRKLPSFITKLNGWLMLDDNRYIRSLNNLEYIKRGINAHNSRLESLGNLRYVGDDLILIGTQIEDLGNLEYVGGDLELIDTPLGEMMTEDEIRERVNVKGDILLVD